MEPGHSSSLPITWRASSPEPAYHEASVGRVFNRRRPSRYPLAVVHATKEQDIVDAVRLAIEKKCRVSVRSGGHSWAAWSVRDDAILLDLGGYSEVELDEKTGIVRASPSTTGRILNGYLIPRGVLFGGGHCPEVGIGGFLLQGGMGWNCRNWGWACEKVAAIDVVTADGKSIHADSKQNSDLLWAARGAGPGFPGIVTRFYLETRPAPKVMRSSAYIYPVSKYKTAFDWILKITPEYDDGTEIVAVGSYPPDLDEPCITVLLVTFKDTEEDAQVALQPAEDSHPAGSLAQWFCKETSLDQEYDSQEAANPSGHRYTADNAYISNTADVPAVLEKAFTTLPSRKAFALWYAMYPCSRRVLPDMALSMQSDHYFAIYTIWEDERDDQQCQSWVRTIMQKVEKKSEGAYVGDSDFQVRRTMFWGEKEGERLMQVRRKWDPEGRICGYLDAGDKSGTQGLENVHEWKDASHASLL